MSLDTFVALGATSASELWEARAVELCGLGLSDVSLLASCPALRIVLLHANSLSSFPRPLLSLPRLVKLDLSSNALEALPRAEELCGLGGLKVLYLHDNRLASLKACRALAALPSLTRLSLAKNPLDQHPAYRHFLVNTIATLRCLDEYLVSDEELIEGAQFASGQYQALSDAARFELVMPPTRLADGSVSVDFEEQLSRSLLLELSALSRAHRRVSPVLTMQAGIRARVGRRKAALLLEARADGPQWAVEAANSQSRTAAAAVMPSSGIADMRMRNRQILRRGREPHDEQPTALHAQSSSSSDVSSAYEGNPTLHLYIPRKHMVEMESLLPDEGQATMQGSPYYLIPGACGSAAEDLMRGRAASKAAAGAVVRRRRRTPRAELMRLRMVACRADEEAVRASPSLARPRLVFHSAEAAHALQLCATAIKEEAAREVPEGYKGEQLVRIKLETPQQVKKLQRLIEQRNGVQSATWEEEPEGTLALLSVLALTLTGTELLRVHAATTLTRAARSRLCVLRLRPGSFVLRSRAATRMQRSFRNHVAFVRMHMLRHMRERVAACTSNRLYLPTQLFEALSGRLPLHAAELWPEHRIRFSFSEPPLQQVVVHAAAGAIRLLPKWAAPEMPEGESEPPELPEQTPLSLLSIGVRVPPTTDLRGLGRFVRRQYTSFVFSSSTEAKRRTALVAICGYDALNALARHGMLLGHVHIPLMLFSEAEVARHEAASAIGAGWHGYLVRSGIYRQLLEVHEAELAAAAAAEAARRAAQPPSLLWEKGDLPIEALILPPIVSPSRSKPGSRLTENLKLPQLAMAMGLQSDELQLRGLPPMVGEAQHNLNELQKRKAAEVRGMRDDLTFSLHIRARRDASALEHLRAAVGTASAQQAASNHVAARTLRTMQKMLQAKLSRDGEDLSAMARENRAEEVELKRQQAAEARAAAKEALLERHEDARLEQEELIMQRRIERRQLQLAASLQREVAAQEVAARKQTLAQARARHDDSVAKYNFAGAFSRRHNSMTRQVRRGEMRKLEQARLLEAHMRGTAAREDALAKQAAAEQRAMRLEDARRLGIARHRAEVRAGLAERILAQQQEIAALRMRNEQLNEIRSLLTDPPDPPPINPSEIGIKREPYTSMYDDGIDLSQPMTRFGKQYTVYEE